jgi:predicted nuclease with TOPRIM domain
MLVCDEHKSCKVLYDDNDVCPVCRLEEDLEDCHDTIGELRDSLDMLLDNKEELKKRIKKMNDERINLLEEIKKLENDNYIFESRMEILEEQLAETL